MTIQELLDRVPWGEMEERINRGVSTAIRHRVTDACPICAAFGIDGKLNARARIYAMRNGMTKTDASAVIRAADGYSIDLYREMLRRMRQARQGQ